MEGVPFPYWGDEFQWEASARATTRSRTAARSTVYYDNPKGARAAYTILGGDKIDAPSGARKQTKNGITLWIAEDHGRRIVTWTRNGHTCVLSARSRCPSRSCCSWRVGRTRVTSLSE